MSSSRGPGKVVDTESTDETRFVKLRQFNIAMAILHFVQGGLMVWLSNDFSLPVETTFLRYDPVLEQTFQQTETLVNLQLGPLIASFLFMSAIAHFGVSTPGGYRWYVKNLKKGINYARWYEYAASSSVMVVVIAMLCGIFEFSALMALFALNATMNLFGLMMELHNQTTEKTNWTSYVFGCFAGLVVWIVLGVYFFGALLSATESIPTFVYFIFVSIAVFFNIFAVNMVLQYRGKGRYKDYLHGEKVYIILSLTAKSALAWQVFAGTLRGA